MEFKHETLEARFTVPDHPTVREILKYDSERDREFGADIGFYERVWRAAKTLIQEWECPYFELYPVPKNENEEEIIDILDSTATGKVVDVIRWAGLAVFSYRVQLDELGKN